MKPSKCPRKDGDGNHYVHRDMHGGFGVWMVRMCNSRGAYIPVSEAHGKAGIK